MSRESEQQYVDLKVWDLFRNRFKSPTTEASYWSDIMEFCRMTGKPFTETTRTDVKKYYDRITDRMRNGIISPITRTKKFRELHSFASFLMEQGDYMPGSEFDHFYPYLKNMKKETVRAGSVPVEDMDALLSAASDDLMAYTILTLMYRAGLTSTEIIELKSEDDFAGYERGALAMLKSRQDPCYIPEDAWKILKKYMAGRDVEFYSNDTCSLADSDICRIADTDV